MLVTNDSLSLKKSSTYFFWRHEKKAVFVVIKTVWNSTKHICVSRGICFRLTFFLSGSSLYFLERILVRSRLLISGCNFAYLALFSMKKRKYGVKGFLGKSGCFCVWRENKGGEGGFEIWVPLRRLGFPLHEISILIHLYFLALVRILDVVLRIDYQLCEGPEFTNLWICQEKTR